MIQSVKEIFNIQSIQDLKEALDQFEVELEFKHKPLIDMLDKNILSQDISSVEMHMTFVESWRARVVRYLAFSSAFVEHAKDSTFLPSTTSVEGKKITGAEIDAFRRKTAGGFVALQIYLEGIVDCIDSRVNICKKILGLEDSAPRKKSL